MTEADPASSSTSLLRLGAGSLVVALGVALALAAAGTAATLQVSGRLADSLGRRPLVVVGLVDNGGDALKKTGGFNANLWVGIGLVVAGIVFALWSRLRPIVVAPTPERDAGDS